MCCSVNICSSRFSPQATVNACMVMVHPTDSKGTSAPAPTACPALCPSLIFVFAGLFLKLLFLTPLLLCYVLPFLKYVYLEGPSALLMGLAVCCIWSVSSIEQTLAISERGYPCSILITTTLPLTLNTFTYQAVGMQKDENLKWEREYWEVFLEMLPKTLMRNIKYRDFCL